ncbi:MAG TPA: ABC transporter substrate-binding protein [Acidimicrobiales bacterium]|nr:ABC transporter substrate-binding protein [Acidimicrobiales bacterium]
MTTTRVQRVLAATLVVVAVAASACNASSSSGAIEKPPANVPQDLRVAAGTDPFTAANGQRPGGANPNVGQGAPGGPQALGPLRPTTARVGFGIFETLTRLTPSYTVAPGLADSWRPMSATTWRFALHKGVTFHDGTPLTAGEVLPVLAMAAQRQDPIRGLEADSARALNDLEIEIHLSAPNQRLPEQLANPSLAIMKPGTTAGRGDAPDTTPTGTGPFRFASYDPAAGLRVEAYPRYWGKAPLLRSITFRFGTADETAKLLTAGEVDAVLPSAAAEVPASAKLVVSDPARAVYLLLNAQGTGDYALLADEAVRRAVALAVDREAFAKATGARVQPNDTLVPPLLLGRSDRNVSSPAHDPAGARTALDDDGWVPGPDGVRVKDGRRLDLSLVVGNGNGGGNGGDGQDAAVAALQADLAAVGIGLLRQNTPGAAAIQVVNQGSFDLYLETRIQDDANPCSFCRLFANRPGGLLAVSSAAAGGPQADALFDQAFGASKDADVEESTADLLHLVTAVRYVAVPLSLSGTAWFVSPRIRGFVPSPVPGAQAWHTVFLA